MIKSKLVTYHTPNRYYCMKSFIFAKLVRNSLFIVKNFTKGNKAKLFTVCFQYHSHGQNMKLCTGIHNLSAQKCYSREHFTFFKHVTEIVLKAKFLFMSISKNFEAQLYGML